MKGVSIEEKITDRQKERGKGTILGVEFRKVGDGKGAKRENRGRIRASPTNGASLRRGEGAMRRGRFSQLENLRSKLVAVGRKNGRKKKNREPFAEEIRKTCPYNRGYEN